MWTGIRGPASRHRKSESTRQSLSGPAADRPFHACAVGFGEGAARRVVSRCLQHLPLRGEGGNNLLTIEGTKPPFLDRPLADVRGVNSDYFATMSITLRQGRIFEEADRERLLAVVSALTARRLWPGDNPLGKRFKIGDPGGSFVEVAGIVGDVRGVSLDHAPSRLSANRWRSSASK